MILFINPPFGNYINLPNTIPIRGSFTLEPRKGLFSQIFKTLRYSFEHKGWINKIGLRNKGINYAISTYKEDQIISIAIMKDSEIKLFNKKIPKNMNLELNISCPNTDKKLISTGLKCFLNNKRKWCIIKLSPLTDKKLIDSYYKQGFRQFHCCNTIPINEGGLSGPKLIPYVSKQIIYIKKYYPDTIIIAGGGIRTWNDINHYKTLNADHIGISSILFNPINFLILYYKYIKNI
jgi:dihydroorotate dehydrogenase